MNKMSFIIDRLLNALKKTLVRFKNAKFGLLNLQIAPCTNVGVISDVRITKYLKIFILFINLMKIMEDNINL